MGKLRLSTLFVNIFVECMYISNLLGDKMQGLLGRKTRSNNWKHDESKYKIDRA